MINLAKYRKLSVSAVILLILTWFAALAAVWNTLLTTEAKNEGWIIVFMIIVFLSGISLFYLAFVNADTARIEKIRKEAFEAGKSEVLVMTEKKKETEHDEQAQNEAVRSVSDAVLAGIHGVRSENGLCNKLLTALAREMGFVQGIIYVRSRKDSVFNPSAVYALTERKPEPFREGETLAGQAAQNKTMTVIHDIPENYFLVASGLGNAMPKYLLLIPMLHGSETIAVLELAAFKKPDDSTEKILDRVLTEAAQKLNKIVTAPQS